MINSLLLLSLSLAAQNMEHIHGQIVDGWNGQALKAVRLIDLDGKEIASSNENGLFSGQVIAHMPRLHIEAADNAHEKIWFHLPRDAQGQLLNSALRISLLPLHPQGPPGNAVFGLPNREAADVGDDDNGANPTLPTWSYNLPANLPETIRVLRCPGTTCCSAPGDGIETLPFEEYIRGVVNSEVGVFRSVSTVDGNSIDSAAREAGSREVFKTFAVSARGYALYWYLRRAAASDLGYDIRDGTCEQVYDDARNPWVSAAVDATAGQVMGLNGGSSIEKFEYASSCKRLGSLPYGVSATNPSCSDTISDTTGIVACVNTWCGHDTAGMGHQEHPCDPNGCRCLVRGICQWGACERSYTGDNYHDIIAHYQPNLQIVQLGSDIDAGQVTTTGSLVGYIRVGDIQNSDQPIASATISLSSGQSTQSNAQGFYTFSDLQAEQTLTIEVSALGFESASADKYLDPSYSQWWTSFGLNPVVTQDAGSSDLVLQDVRSSDSSSSDLSLIDAGRSDLNLTEAGSSTDINTQAGDSAKTKNGCCCAHQEKSSTKSFLLISLGIFFIWIRRRKTTGRSGQNHN